jgi:surface antigen/peptidoglycan hydrolase CwlO-like protein
MPNKKFNNQSKPLFARLRRTPAVLLVSCLVLVGAGIATPFVRADQFDDQINALRQQNAGAQSALNDLLSQASSYQDAINQLQQQIDAVQAAIAANEAQQADLQAKITAEQVEIDKQKAILANDVKTTYVNGQLTPVEMLATSQSLSDYIDKQEAYSRVQDSIQKTMAQIQELQRSLQAKKAEVDQLLESQKAQNDQLTATQQKQNELLAYNQGQQDAFNSQISSNSSKIADLRRQQAILNAKYNIGNFVGSADNGGYPNAWANAPQDSLIDSWGMYNRECVSYTAFKVHQDYLSGRDSHDMPWWGGIGNANQWDDNASASGIPVDNNPTPGSIAVSNAGFYGHVMYVEAVNGNQIYVQQYNQQLTGQYSEGWRYTTGLVFIHF